MSVGSQNQQPQNNFMIDSGLHETSFHTAHGPSGGQAGSVQTQRKRRLIMHDNLTNSRGNNRNQSGSPHMTMYGPQSNEQQQYD